MKISILTLPLYDNYGAFLQNYALQIVLKKIGNEPYTLDWFPPPKTLYVYIRSWIKTFMLRLVGKKRPFMKVERPRCRTILFEKFMNDYIFTIGKKQYINVNMLENSKAIVVGSDQIWRPKYTYHIEDSYLRFMQNVPIKKIAYAASFGVDEWEYSPKQTKVCSALAQKFDAISVREESGVKLCKEHLGVDATWVLDPTLLLKKEDYLSICEEIPICGEKYLAVYVLDENEQVSATYENEAAVRGLVVKKFYADLKSTLTVPEWLAMFRDASYVVTDSFHGTVFSIIFGKEFKCLYNKSRGSARFDSLIKLYKTGRLDEMRCFSLTWLKNALEK